MLVSVFTQNKNSTLCILPGMKWETIRTTYEFLRTPITYHNALQLTVYSVRQACSLYFLVWEIFSKKIF